MDANLDDKESLVVRIQQLEHERDGLRKDVEQLCIQQAGPSYLAVATRMHFQRTAGLEQEIENLKNKLSVCTKENANLQEELSEAYRIKTQLADLHRMEVSKNKEAEKQVKFFQGCVAAAFAERDHSIMEAEKAKEKEEFMSQKFNEFEQRLEELSSECLEQKRRNDELQVELAKQEEQSETFEKVINKFYEIRQQSLKVIEDASWDYKFTCLLHDSADMWSYKDDSVSKYISALEEELATVRISLENLQSRLHMGLEIEKHLKRKVCELEKQQIVMDRILTDAVSWLRDNHSQLKAHVMNLLQEGRSQIKVVTEMTKDKIRQLDVSRLQMLESSQEVSNIDESNCQNVHITNNAISVSETKKGDYDPLASMADIGGSISKALAQAMQEKVAALLLLSQQEERHLLEKNVNVALQKKIEELHRNLLQVTNEKVRALMELAQLKQDYKQLKDKLGNHIRLGNSINNTRENNHERDGRLGNLLKRTNLSRWISVLDIGGNETEATPRSQRRFSFTKTSNFDYASMKIENATLKESMQNMEHLTSSIHKLHLALLKAKESINCATVDSSEALDEIVSEAKLVKTALASSLPVSWSAGDKALVDECIWNEPGDAYGDTSNEKLDHVSAAGFEMVELLILAAQLLKDYAMLSWNDES